MATFLTGFSASGIHTTCAEVIVSYAIKRTFLMDGSEIHLYKVRV